MAAVHGPAIAQHPTTFQAHNIPAVRMGFHPAPAVVSNTIVLLFFSSCGSPIFNQPAKPAQPQPPPTRPDPYYGHESTARLCGRFITHLFACPEYPPTSSGSNTKLPHFIAYALHRTKLHASVTFAALVLLQRLKARFPTARGSSGHRLFISAFMIASKVICDDTYSNKSWSIVGQGMFQLREINQMEREMCQYLDWELNVEPSTLKEFEDMVRKDFAGPGPYPTYILQTISKLAATSANPFPAIAPNTSTSPIPSFGPRQASPPKPTPPPPSIPKHPASAYLTPPTTPDTPEPCYSDTTSPTSSASPPTPTGMIDDNVKIVSHDTSPGLSIAQQAALDYAIMKQKMFAFAQPSKW
jgi:hypothetical protein